MIQTKKICEQKKLHSFKIKSRERKNRGKLLFSLKGDQMSRVGSKNYHL